jgi:ethanolamine permease
MTQLQKTLGPIAIWGLGVGYVISGMYFGWNLGLPEGGPYGLLLATGIVTVFYVAFVLGYAELACAMPRAGGAFVYTSRAFGSDIGFIGGVAQLVEYAFATPTVALAIGDYVNQAVPSLPSMAVAVTAYVLFTAINMFGVKLSATFEVVLTVLAVIELCVFGVAVLPSFSWDKFSLDPLPNGWGGTIAALPFGIWFYLAIEGVANIAEEAREPQRDLPRGFIAAMATLVVLTAVVLFGAVGADGWRAVVYPDGVSGDASNSPLPLAIGHVVSKSSPVFVVLTSVGLVGLVASLHGILIAASRSLLELGRAGYAPRIVGVINAKTRTPIAALTVNMVIGFAALATGKTDEILLISVFGALTLYILSSGAVIRLRRTQPDLARPYRTPLYPVTPVLAFVLAAICLCTMVWLHPGIAGIYAAIVVGAWLLFSALVPPEQRATV